jgi:N6-adenosine-specific RNA methylase IME4
MDPPWTYRDSTARGSAARHYPTMTLEELKRLPIPELADKKQGAYFWIWATFPKIRDRVPHELIDHWGLRWVGEVVWDKQRIGPGRWLRSRAEVLILAVTGKPPVPSDRGQGNIFALPDVEHVTRTPKHSQKPAQFRDLIERLSPGPRLELFARESAPGWDCWGNEAPPDLLQQGQDREEQEAAGNQPEGEPVRSAPHGRLVGDGSAPALQAVGLELLGPDAAGQQTDGACQ